MTHASHFKTWIGIVLVVAATSTGCSYALVHGPSPAAEWRASDQSLRAGSAESCTTSNAAPVIDTVMALPLVALGGLAVYGAVDAGKHCGPPQCVDSMQFGTVGEWTAIAAGALAFGTLAIASAATGYARTADCRQLQEMLPGPPHRTDRYLLDLSGLAEARAHPEWSSTSSLR